MTRCVFLMLLCLSSAAMAQDYTTLYGSWRGQTQYQATIGTAVDQSAHAVVPLALEIDAAGRVRGMSPDNGCKFLGIAGPGVAPTIMNLDVTLSGCHYAGFNKRYGGMLALYAQGKYTSLSLRAHQMVPGKAPVSLDIKATMRR